MFGDDLRYDRTYVVGMVNAEPRTNGVHTMTATLWLNRKHTIFGGAIVGLEDIIGSVKANKMDSVIALAVSPHSFPFP